ncbi:serine/threonine-protein kinase [Planctomicrobium sp. SH668]|uniref:serine/threonine-protein kinase n=1 Tax=Planctomicrobium sp. SH668 TaxID=3448126 RepID=UPI003F5C45DF
MTSDSTNGDPSLGWVHNAINIDESLRSGAPTRFSQSTPSDGNLSWLLSNLQRMHAPPATSYPARLMTGAPEKIGRYVVRRTIGSGGFAVVYHAFDPHLHREVAVKIPLPLRLLNEEVRTRFVQEARLAAQLDHPHIVPAFEAGEDGPIPFIAYAYCSGPTLAAWIQSHPQLKPQAVAELMAQLADAVEYSHQQGILHRDLKPANVLLFPTSKPISDDFAFIPRLADFGLAKLVEAVSTDTRSSVIIGTPSYLAPEQIDAVNPKSISATDIYGLGIIMYETLTGHPPYRGKNVVQVLEEIREGTIEPLRVINLQIPKDLAVICEKAMSRDPADRYSSAADFRDDLNRYLRGEKITARPLGVGAQIFRALTAPSRISEASAFLIISFTAMGFWMALWPVGGLLGFATSSVIPASEIIGYTLPLMINSIIAIVLGWQVGRGKVWAAVVATVLGAGLCGIAISVLCQWIQPFFPQVYSDPRTREIVYLLLLCLFVSQTILSACAWGAIRRQRKLTS